MPYSHVYALTAASAGGGGKKRRRKRKEKQTKRKQPRNPKARRRCGCTRCPYRAWHLAGELKRAGGVRCPQCGGNVVEVDLLD